MPEIPGSEWLDYIFPEYELPEDQEEASGLSLPTLVNNEVGFNPTPSSTWGTPEPTGETPSSWYQKFAGDMFNTGKYYGGRLQTMVNKEFQPTHGQAEGLRHLINKEFPGITPSTADGVPRPGAVEDSARWYHKAAQTVGAGAMSVLDYLQRGQYASAKFFDVMASDGWMALGKAISSAAKEVVDPEFRLSFADVIKKHNPALAEASPMGAEVLGFIGDIVLDPTTYITLGTTSLGSKMVPRIIPKGGEYAGKVLNLTDKGSAIFKDAMVRHGFDRERAILSVTKAITAGRKGIAYEQEAKKLYVGWKAPGVRQLGVGIPLPGLELGSKFMGLLKALPVGKYISKKFAPLSAQSAEHIQQYVRARDSIVEAYEQERRDALATFEQIWKGHDEDALKRMGEAGTRISDITELYASSGQTLSGAELAKIKDEVFDTFKLKPKERTSMAQAMQKYTDLYALEKEAGLTFDEIANYHPRMYVATSEGASEAVKGEFLEKQIAQVKASNLPDKMKALEMEKLRRMQTSTTSSKAVRVASDVNALTGAKQKLYGFMKPREFTSLDEAVALGYVPELDAAKVMTRRWVASVRARRETQFKTLLDGIEKSGRYSTGEVKMLKRDLNNVGAASLSAEDDLLGKVALGTWDTFLSVFRRSATVFRPAFAVRTFTDNLARQFLVTGVKGFGAYSRESLRVVFPMLSAMSAPGYEGLEKIVLRSPFGDVYNGRQLKDLMEKYNVATGRALGVGKSYKAERQMERQLMQAHKDLAFADKGDVVAQGKKNIIKTMHHYWNWAGHVEDFTRTAAFMNGLAHGHSPDAAAKLTNDIFFDYVNGLGDFESRVLKRVVPFYTFNRFIWPQIFKGFATTPGRVAAIKKSVDLFFTGVNRMFAGEDQTLTEAERFALPGWLLEQPHTYLGMGQDMKAHFAAFNNFTPLDTMGFLEIDQTQGDKVDVGRSVIKQFLSTVAPMIKIPFEMALNRNLFTDRVIKSTQYEVGSDKLRLGPWTEKPFEIFDRVMPGEIKKMIGFEVVTDPRDGTRKAYVNPYLMHFMKSNAPVLNDVVRTLDDRLTPRETAVSILSGVAQYKLDLKQQAEYRRVAIKKAIEEQEEEIKQARKQGRAQTEIALWNELNELVGTAAQEWDKLKLDKIRGTDLDPETPGNTGYRAGRWGNPLKKGWGK